MYGLVLMVVVGGAGDAPAFGKRDKGCLGGCHGDVVVVVSAPACCPAPAPVCCPAPERKGLFGRLKDKCHRHAPVACCPAPTPACCTSSTPPAAGGHDTPKPMGAKPEDKKPEEKKAKD